MEKTEVDFDANPKLENITLFDFFAAMAMHAMYSNPAVDPSILGIETKAMDIAADMLHIRSFFMKD